MYSSKFKGVYKGLFKNLNHISWLRKKKKGGKEMATKEDLKKIAIKCIEDDAFRASFEKDPVKAAGTMGIKLTADQAKNLKEKAAKVEAAGQRESKGLFSAVVSNVP